MISATLSLLIGLALLWIVVKFLKAYNTEKHGGEGMGMILMILMLSIVFLFKATGQYDEFIKPCGVNNEIQTNERYDNSSIQNPLQD